MSDASGFPNLVPGFDFLQSLVKNAGSALPGIGQWVAPTLNPEELEKRISELRTVQFWLEQNGRMIGATIQALEVQRMTLSTLKTMNVQMGDLQESMKIHMPTAAAGAATMASLWPSAAAAAPAAAPAAPAAAPATPAAPAATSDAAAPGVVDPMQWWGALTKQFAELATTAMKDTGGDAARTMAESMVKQTLDNAGQAVKSVSDAAAAAVGVGAAASAASAKPARASKAASADSSAKASTAAAARKPAAPRG